MKPPISFLLDLILDHKLPDDALKACRKYIRELERNVRNVAPSITPPKAAFVGKVMHGAVQAPSTQKILDEMAAQTGAPLPTMPVIPTAQRIQGGEVNTGNGTRGPKKW